MTVGFAVADTSYFKVGEHGCPIPVLKSCNSARFSVLPGRKLLSPNESGIPGERVIIPSVEKKRDPQRKNYLYIEK